MTATQTTMLPSPQTNALSMRDKPTKAGRTGAVARQEMLGTMHAVMRGEVKMCAAEFQKLVRKVATIGNGMD